MILSKPQGGGTMLRPIKLTDADQIKTINEVELGYKTDIDLVQGQIIKLSQDRKHFLLAYEDELSHQVLAYIHAEVYESLYSKPGFNILALAVSKDFQNKGIGKKLMLALETEAKTKGYDFIRFNSAETRHHAHKFYESLGYVSDKLQKRFIKMM